MNLLKAASKNVYIPLIHPEYTSQRTLVLEWIDGVKITNSDGLRAQGLDVSKAIKTTLEAFAEQIFVFGFFQADPHPGNIFVRQNPATVGKHK
jgi:aarF domain-containing kinase